MQFNKKVQMLDAGMVLFKSEENFGNTLGQVKAEMEVYGKVLKPSEIEDVVLPESTGDCDLFLNWSTFWRIRYISCHLESSGDGYAATFKEGNRSTTFRGIVMSLLLISFAVVVIFAPGTLYTLLGLILAGLTAYLWILPSRKAQKTVAELMRKLGA